MNFGIRIKMKIIIFVLLGYFFSVSLVCADMLWVVSDLISTSAPGVSADHSVQFTITNNVPAGGKIIITPETGFDIPAFFDHTDVDLAIATSTGSPFIQRDLAAVVNATEDGVSVVTGTSGSVTFTLHAGGGINAGEIALIKLGSHTTHEEIGDQQITNSTSTGSHQIDIETRDAVDQDIDSANTLVFIIDQVTVGPVDTTDDTPPGRSNGLPTSGILLPGGTQNVQISLETDEQATCRYSETAGTAYGVMTDFFEETFAILHTVVVTGLTDDTTYSYYVRCIDYQSNANPDDYEITFDIGVVPAEPGSGGVETGSGGGESGDGVGGGPYDFGGPYLGSAQVILDGASYPGSKVTILRDGTLESTLSVGANGKFNTTIENLTRGTYTFGIFAVDSFGQKSNTYTSTISIIADSGNTISRIFLPPTISVENDTLDPGEEIVVFGQAIPESLVEVFLGEQAKVAGADTIIATTTSSASGEWDVFFDTEQLSLETYTVKARSTVSGEKDPGDFSKLVYVGVGGEPEPDFSLRADLNKDGKVNIVDFSILLFNWGTDDDIADINMDGNVDLTDFSIMVFYWTG